MRPQAIAEDLLSAQEARALRFGPAVARAVDVRAIASAVIEEARHGKPGTVRDLNAVFVWRVGKALTEARDRGRIREQRTHEERERYARLWLILLEGAIQQQSGPATLAATLRTFRANGYPHLNPRLIELLQDLGASWSAPPSTPALTPPAECATPRRRQRQSREGKNARAHARAR